MTVKKYGQIDILKLPLYLGCYLGGQNRSYHNITIKDITRHMFKFCKLSTGVGSSSGYIFVGRGLTGRRKKDDPTFISSGPNPLPYLCSAIYSIN